MNCQQRIEHTEEFFKDLYFEEARHRYTVNGQSIKSVSGLIKYFELEKDWTEIAERYAFKHKTTTSKVLAEWHETGRIAAEDGTSVHLYGEVEHKYRQAKVKKEEAIDKFYGKIDKKEKGRYVILHKELRMYHKEHLFAGTADLVIRDLYTGYDIIGDWKTNKDIHKNFAGQTLLKPFQDLLESPLSKYKLQLNFYQLLYEQTGFEIGEKWLIWLKDTGEYELYKIPDYRARLYAWLENKTFVIQ